VRCSQASPVHPRQAQPACCGLDKAYEDVVIAKRLPRSNALEHEIFWTIALNNFMPADCVTGFHLDGELPQSMNPLDDAAVHSDGCIGSFALRRTPIAAAKPLIDRDRVCSDVIPAQARQFTDS
jgi:hypothetical protein